MKTLDELKAFFESDLRPDLQDLESLRLKKIKKTRTLRIIMLPLIFIPVGLLGIGHMTGEDIFNVIIFQFLYIVAIVITWALMHSRIFNSYRPPEFKTVIMSRIVKFINPELKYDPQKHISIKDYLDSRIFYHGRSTYDTGDDLVTGSIGKTNFAFSEIKSYEKWTNSKGNECETTFFHGLFFFADFNKRFKGMTFILPSTKVRRYGKVLGNYFHSRKKNYGELVKLEDPRFEKEFVVYSGDQIEARYILSTDLIKRICDYRKKTQKDIHISFVNNRVHVAVSYSYNLFEINLNMSLLDFRIIQGYFEDMLHAIGIVEDLNLNTRIWN
ncbi:MAG: DUF3137 domain-containing protein [Spirochaetes bacterium]|jgi:hypothetical protein|nr:DUF3137 domain-containing protein [Spirochaetota bacterium]